MADYSKMLSMVEDIIAESDEEKRTEKVNILKSAIKTSESDTTALEEKYTKSEKENADLARLNSKLYLQVPSSRENKKKEEQEQEQGEEEQLTYADLEKKRRMKDNG